MATTPINYERCAFIVRGRGQQQTDQLLPEFCRIVKQFTPNKEAAFNESALQALQAIILGGVTKKTADNYRTEILGKLLGLYYVDCERNVLMSDRAKRLNKTQDHIQFFKDLCCRLQVPSAMSKNADQFAKKRIKFWPASTLIKVMRAATMLGCRSLTKKEVNYFVFSNLDVLTGTQTPNETAKIIALWRAEKEEPYIGGGSKVAQHSNEVLNLMANANLVKFNEDEVSLNLYEQEDIDRILAFQIEANYFDISRYNLETDKRSFELDWDAHYSRSCFKDEKVFATKTEEWGEPEDEESDLRFTIAEPTETIAAPTPHTFLTQPSDQPPTSKDEMQRLGTKQPMHVGTPIQGSTPIRLSTKVTGDAGEQYVWSREKKLVSLRLPNEADRVLSLGARRGLGFDVQSVFTDSETDDNFKYIEVKSSRCVTRPMPKQRHTLTLTENEYKAARQHRLNFYIFRVYLLPEKDSAVVYALRDPVGTSEREPGVRMEKKISEEAITYEISMTSEQCTLIEYER